MLGYQLHRSSTPHLVGDKIAAQHLVDDPQAAAKLARGMVLGQGRDQADWRFLAPDMTTQQIMDAMKRIGDEISQESGIPPTVQGYDIDRGEASGVSLERIMFTAQARVREQRRALEFMIPEVFKALGVTGKINVTWSGDPFSTAQTRNDQIRDYFESGLYGRKFSLRTMGLDPDVVMEGEEEEQEAEREAQERQMQMMQQTNNAAEESNDGKF